MTTRLNPVTTPRHELRAEKARRSETGSATGSRNRSNEAALVAFTARKAEIDEMLVRLQALSDDHFNAHPDEINWGHVGTLEHYSRRPHFDHTQTGLETSCTSGGNHRSLLKRITDSAFGEGEHAK